MTDTVKWFIPRRLDVDLVISISCHSSLSVCLLLCLLFDCTEDLIPQCPVKKQPATVLSPTDTIQLKCRVHKTHPLDPEGAEEKRRADIRLQTTLIWTEIVLVVKDILADQHHFPPLFSKELTSSDIE